VLKFSLKLINGENAMFTIPPYRELSDEFLIAMLREATQSGHWYTLTADAVDFDLAYMAA
jgi:hypothetical protein